MKRANGVMQYAYDAPSGEMRWAFGGKVADVVFVIPNETVVTGICLSAMIHGFKQKIGDAAALGQSATSAEKRDAMQRVVDALNGGEWSPPRGEGAAVGSMLARAIAEAKGKPVADVVKWLAGRSAIERNALAVGKYADAIAVMRKAKVGPIDEDAIDAEIDAI